MSDRLRLFESVISPTVLYGSETWTLTAEMARLLKTTQRRMLRTILGQGRRMIQRSQQTASDDHRSEDSAEDSATMHDDEDVLEPWVDWIRRVTHSVEYRMEKLKIKPWIEQARKRKWRFAAELYSGNGERKWSHIALEWNPQIHFDARQSSARRKPTRPNLRWSDELRNYAKDYLRPGQSWNDVCPDAQFWKTHETNFINRIAN